MTNEENAIRSQLACQHRLTWILGRVRKSTRPFDSGFVLGFLMSGFLYGKLLRDSMIVDARDGRIHYFTAAAMGLVRGRLYVPMQTLDIARQRGGAECFFIKSRCFGYFGITPSLLRIPFVVFRGSRSYWSFPERWFFLLGFVVMGIGCWWISRGIVEMWGEHVRWPSGLVGFVAAVTGIGASPVIFLVALPMMYQEAILWGVAFASVAIGAALSMWSHGLSPLKVVLLIAADALAVSARPTVGVAGLFATVALGVLVLRDSRFTMGDGESGGLTNKPAWGAILVVGAFLAFATAPAFTYAKFGTLSPPYDRNPVLYGQPGRLQKYIHSGGVNPLVLPTKLLSALRPDSVRVLYHRPYFVATGGPPTIVWPAKVSEVDYQLPDASVSDTLPFSSAMALIGLMALAVALKMRRHPGENPERLVATIVVLVSAAVAVALILMYPGQTYRYVGDWLPLLFVADAFGLATVANFLNLRRRWVVPVLAVGAILLGTQLLTQVSFTVREGITVGSSRGPVCPSPEDPYGSIGEFVCPAGT